MSAARFPTLFLTSILAILTGAQAQVRSGNKSLMARGRIPAAGSSPTPACNPAAVPDTAGGVVALGVGGDVTHDGTIKVLFVNIQSPELQFNGNASLDGSGILLLDTGELTTGGSATVTQLGGRILTGTGREKTTLPDMGRDRD